MIRSLLLVLPLGVAACSGVSAPPPPPAPGVPRPQPQQAYVEAARPTEFPANFTVVRINERFGFHETYTEVRLVRRLREDCCQLHDAAAQCQRNNSQQHSSKHQKPGTSRFSRLDTGRQHGYSR